MGNRGFVGCGGSSELVFFRNDFLYYWVIVHATHCSRFLLVQTIRKTKRMSIPFVFDRRLEMLGTYINPLASQHERVLCTTFIARRSKHEYDSLTSSNCHFTQKLLNRKFNMPDYPSIDEVLDFAKNPSSSYSEPTIKETFAMDPNKYPESASDPLTEKKPSQHSTVPENSFTQQRKDIPDDRSLFEEKSGEGKWGERNDSTDLRKWRKGEMNRDECY